MYRTTTMQTAQTKYKRFCMHGASCVKFGCPYTHPSDRPRDCPDGDKCQRRDVCKLHHPRTNSEIVCPYGLHCDKPSCPFAHDTANTTTRFRKPCMHGSFCVKFGCGYAHPPGRRQECEFGIMCTDESCLKLHPRPRKQSSSSTPKFQVGQQVEAQYTVGGAWRSANVLRVEPCSLVLQFMGWSDSVDIPFARIRQQKPVVNKQKLDFPPGFGSFASRGAAVAAPLSPSRNLAVCKVVVTPPSSPPRNSTLRQVFTPKSSPPRNFASHKVVSTRTNKSDNLIHLQRLKQAAVLNEDFLLANRLKQQIKELNHLEIQKADAVRKEDFLVAMDIKERISQLINDNTSSELRSAEAETKQQEPHCRAKKAYDTTCDQFSLFSLTHLLQE